MKILFLHGWQSIPGGVKPMFLAKHGHEVINPKLPDEDWSEAVRIAQAEFDKHQPVVVGSSRGGAVAMNINSGDAKLVLLCPAWKKWGTANKVKPGTTILHSRADDVVPFADSEELIGTSGLPTSALIEVGTDHRLADPEPLAAMLRACEFGHRLAPNLPFPPYAFIPGRNPHPTSDPAGHSFGAEPAIPSQIDPEKWHECQAYLYGMDLFNAGYYWESHVAWESLWLASGRKGILADFLKGLIKLAAAGVKALEGKPEGVKSHSGRAAELWREMSKSQVAVFMGFRIEELIKFAVDIHEQGWPRHATLRPR